MTSRHSFAVPSPLERYHAMLESGQLQPDAAQARAAAALDALNRRLKNYRPGKRGLFGLDFGAPESAPQGIYLYGDVGRGKSFLMDLFFASSNIGRRGIFAHRPWRTSRDFDDVDTKPGSLAAGKKPIDALQRRCRFI